LLFSAVVAIVVVCCCCCCLCPRNPREALHISWHAKYVANPWQLCAVLFTYVQPVRCSVTTLSVSREDNEKRLSDEWWVFFPQCSSSSTESFWPCRSASAAAHFPTNWTRSSGTLVACAALQWRFQTTIVSIVTPTQSLPFS
jgi:hypothetical protein